MFNFIIIIIIMKTNSTGLSGKNKLCVNYFRNPTITCATENWKTQLMEATNGWQLL